MPGANNMRDKKAGGSKHKFISKKTKKREKADEEAKQKAKEPGASKLAKAPPLGEGNLRVLLLGEGDFSFAAALAYVWAASAGDCDMATATTLGTEASTLAIEGAEPCGGDIAWVAARPERQIGRSSGRPGAPFRRRKTPPESQLAEV